MADRTWDTLEDRHDVLLGVHSTRKSDGGLCCFLALFVGSPLLSIDPNLGGDTTYF
jgi:hypothetical protein